MRKIGWAGIVMVVLVACGKTQPQRPTYRGEENADTTVVQLLAFNQQMAAQADVQLAHLATADFVLMDENYWVKGLYPQKSNQACLQEGEYVDYTAEIYSLKEELLATHQATVKLGQVDEIQAIANVLPRMQHAMHITMLVPWYMAFGSTGNSEVPPYENIYVELSVQ